MRVWDSEIRTATTVSPFLLRRGWRPSDLRLGSATVGALDFGPFLSLPEGVRERLAAASVPIAFSPGDTLVREGDPPGDVFALATGRVRIMAGDQHRTLATLAAPAPGGEMSVLLALPPSATIVATPPSAGLPVPSLALAAGIESSPGLGQELQAFAQLRSAS